VLRPEIYRRVVQLLAEPREHVSYREICRQCHVTDDTVKAVEQREAVPIATRKQTLMEQAARIARLAADRVEDQIDSATLPQAVVAFGVMTDKVLALSGDPAVIIQHEHQHLHAHKHHFQASLPSNHQRQIRRNPRRPTRR
jgi:transposase-like protein